MNKRMPWDDLLDTLIENAPEASERVEGATVEADKWRIGSRWRSKTSWRVRIIVDNRNGLISKLEGTAEYKVHSKEWLLEHYYYIA